MQFTPSELHFALYREKTDDLLKDMCGIIESSRDAAYRAVNTALVQRNCLLGYRIASEEMQGGESRIWSRTYQEHF